MQLCEYGCGQEATHQFKNGKFCCGNNIGKCSAVNKKGITKKKFFKSIMISEDKNILCDYGCGQRAIYQFNNSKVCCSDNTNGCPSIKLKKIKEEKVIPLIYTGIGLCSYGCGKIAKYKFKNGKICCSSNSSKCPNISFSSAIFIYCIYSPRPTFSIIKRRAAFYISKIKRCIYLLL